MRLVLSALTFGALVFYGIQWYETRNTRELENRAYVLCSGVNLLPATVPTVNDVLVTCVNAGRTPGRNGNIITELEKREASPPEDTVLNPPEKKLSRILFGPQIEIRQRAGFMTIIKPIGEPDAKPAPTGAPSAKQTPTPIPTPAPTPVPEKRLVVLGKLIALTDERGNLGRVKRKKYVVSVELAWAGDLWRRLEAQYDRKFRITTMALLKASNGRSFFQGGPMSNKRLQAAAQPQRWAELI